MDLRSVATRSAQSTYPGQMSNIAVMNNSSDCSIRVFVKKCCSVDLLLYKNFPGHHTGHRV